MERDLRGAIDLTDFEEGEGDRTINAGIERYRHYRLPQEALASIDAQRADRESKPRVKALCPIIQITNAKLFSEILSGYA